jgi:small subunit ribosomal protein S1
VKVLDIDRDRQRISLGLKQTQTDPWQQVVESYREEDVVEGRVAKVVTFGAFVEILPGVEGLVHISELAPHHVENPREVVSQGDAVNVRILEIDGDRRRLSLSLKRVEEGDQPVPRADGAESVHTMPELRLSEEAFPTTSAAPVDMDVAEEAEAEGGDTEADEIVAEVEVAGAEEAAEEIVAEVAVEETEAEEAAEEIAAEVELEEAPAEEAEAEPEADAEPAVEVAAEQHTDSR